MDHHKPPSMELSTPAWPGTKGREGVWGADRGHGPSSEGESFLSVHTCDRLPPPPRKAEPHAVPTFIHLASKLGHSGQRAGSLLITPGHMALKKETTRKAVYTFLLPKIRLQ